MTTLFYDDFERADQPLNNSPNWEKSAANAINVLSIVGGKVTADSAVETARVSNIPTSVFVAPDDYDVSVQVTDSNENATFGPAVNVTPDQNGTFVTCRRNQTSWSIVQYVGGSGASLTTVPFTTFPEPAKPYILTAKVRHLTPGQVRVTLNAGGTDVVFFDVTNSQLQSGQPGFFFYRALAGNAIGSFQVDDTGVDTAPPSFSSASTSTDGNSVTVTFNKNVTLGANGTSGLTITPNGGAAELTYSGGSGTPSLVLTTSRSIAHGETITLDYVQPGDGIKSENSILLADFSNTVANNVPAPNDGTPPVVSSITLATNGSTLTVTYDEDLYFGADGGAGYTINPSGGAATLSYIGGVGTTQITFATSRPILPGETLPVTYTPPADGSQDVYGNKVVGFTANATNNSTYTGSLSIVSEPEKLHRRSQASFILGGAAPGITVGNTTVKLRNEGGDLLTPTLQVDSVVYNSASNITVTFTPQFDLALRHDLYKIHLDLNGQMVESTYTIVFYQEAGYMYVNQENPIAVGTGWETLGVASPQTGYQLMALHEPLPNINVLYDPQGYASIDFNGQEPVQVQYPIYGLTDTGAYIPEVTEIYNPPADTQPGATATSDAIYKAIYKPIFRSIYK